MLKLQFMSWEVLSEWSFSLMMMIMVSSRIVRIYTSNCTCVENVQVCGCLSVFEYTMFNQMSSSELWFWVQICIHSLPILLTGAWGAITDDIGWGRGPPWAGHQPITGPTCWEKQPHTRPHQWAPKFTGDSPVNLMHMKLKKTHARTGRSCNANCRSRKVPGMGIKHRTSWPPWKLAQHI